MIAFLGGFATVEEAEKNLETYKHKDKYTIGSVLVKGTEKYIAHFVIPNKAVDVIMAFDENEPTE